MNEKTPRCAACHSNDPKKHGFKEIVGKQWHVSKYECVQHPLTALFHAAKMTELAGMDWLMEHGLISDNVIEIWEVAKADIRIIMQNAKFRFAPEWIDLQLVKL